LSAGTARGGRLDAALTTHCASVTVGGDGAIVVIQLRPAAA
jgi:hypothetical protein